MATTGSSTSSCDYSPSPKRQATDEAVMANNHATTTNSSDSRSPEKLDMTKPVKPNRARLIRIKSVYNCEEQRFSTLAAPFRGFSVLVRFHCRAKIHTIQKINLANNGREETAMDVSSSSTTTV